MDVLLTITRTVVSGGAHCHGNGTGNSGGGHCPSGWDTVTSPTGVTANGTRGHTAHSGRHHPGGHHIGATDTASGGNSITGRTSHSGRDYGRDSGRGGEFYGGRN